MSFKPSLESYSHSGSSVGKMLIVKKTKLDAPLLDRFKFRPVGGARRKVRGATKSVRFILWGPRMSVQNVTEIHPIAVETFQSGFIRTVIASAEATSISVDSE